VVGVVDDMRQDSVEAPLQPEVFASFKQLVPGAIRNFDPILVIRTNTDPTDYVPTLRNVVREQAPALAVDSIMTMEERVMMSLATVDIGVLVGRQALAMVVGGIVVGLGAAVAAAQWMRSLLYGVAPSDPRSLAAAAVFVALLAAVAIAIPLARATHIEPAAALRQENYGN
jgi:predicted lysophospholipase L1 biosynthesis ABC-type transport system permease subunit